VRRSIPVALSGWDTPSDYCSDGPSSPPVPGDTVEVVRYFGLVTQCGPHHQFPGVPYTHTYCRWSSKRSVPSIWHPAGSTPAPLRWFSGHPRFMATVESERYFPRHPRFNSWRWTVWSIVTSGQRGPPDTGRRSDGFPVAITPPTVVVKLECSFAPWAGGLGSNPRGGIPALV
jgi:hypothetical protein